MGVRGKSYNLMKRCIRGRKQFVGIKNVESDILSMEYGLSQGTVSGPKLSLICKYLFNSIHIADLFDLYSKVYVFNIIS